MIDMTGAIMEAAPAALAMSAPSRGPRFLVFHCCDSSEGIFTVRCVAGAGTGGLASIGRPGAGMASVGLVIPLSFMLLFQM